MAAWQPRTSTLGGASWLLGTSSPIAWKTEPPRLTGAGGSRARRGLVPRSPPLLDLDRRPQHVRGSGVQARPSRVPRLAAGTSRPDCRALVACAGAGHTSETDRPKRLDGASNVATPAPRCARQARRRDPRGCGVAGPLPNADDRLGCEAGGDGCDDARDAARRHRRPAPPSARRVHGLQRLTTSSDALAPDVGAMRADTSLDTLATRVPSVSHAAPVRGRRVSSPRDARLPGPGRTGETERGRPPALGRGLSRFAGPQGSWAHPLRRSGPGRCSPACPRTVVTGARQAHGGRAPGRASQEPGRITARDAAERVARRLLYRDPHFERRTWNRPTSP
jgi:hypothetical protein